MNQEVDPLTRRTLADEAADNLRKAIRAGSLVGLLPGIRPLCQELGISRSALTPALVKLQEEGWLVSAGPRRRYVTNVVLEGTSQLPQPTRKLWILETMEKKQLTGLSPHLLDPLRQRLDKRGWMIERSVVVADQTRRHDQKWRQLLDIHRPDAVLLASPHRTTSQWAADCGVPVCAMGGDVNGLPLSMVGFDTTSMVEEALERLLVLGHRDICLLVSVRTPGFVAKLHATIERVLGRHGIVFVPAWHAPLAHHNTPEGLLELLKRRFALGIPSGILAFGRGGLQTVMAFLLSQGIAMPRDVSVVMLGDSKDIEWVKPDVACFDFRWPRIVSFIVRWLNAGKKGEERYKQVSLKPAWVEGKSLLLYNPRVVSKSNESR